MFAIKGALCIILALSVFISADSDVTSSHPWDVLIFTQHWPATVCYEWMGKKPSHTCSFPAQRDAWTVHGIWPTKLGTIGPGFCNSSWKFDLEQVRPIEPQLEQYWINIEKDTPLPSLWKHEWTKHGTCAAVLPNLNNEMKYFAQGLRWLQLYSMSDILLKSGIGPAEGKSYEPTVLYNTVKTTVGKNPSVHCYVDPKTGISYLFEIRICFDKSMALVDCDGIKVEGVGAQSLLHCDLTKPVVYTNIVPSVPVSSSWEWPLVEIYKLIAWLQWYTL